MRAVPQLVDTTIRLLSQEPLAGKVPTGEVLRIAEILDRAGFACLEVSGGGVFDAAVRRGVESPWERIRALDARTTTPLGIALRGRFLVGSKPVSADIVQRFVSCAAENGIDVFRLHDPLNDVSNLREAAAAIVRAGGQFHAGLVYSPGRSGELDALVEQARELPELGRDQGDRQRPERRAAAAPDTGARRAAAGGERASRRPLHAGRRRHRSRERARGHAGRQPISSPPPSTRSRSRSTGSPGESLVEMLEGLGRATGVDNARLWEASDVIDEHIGDEPVAPIAPRISVRAAEYDLPAGPRRRARPASARRTLQATVCSTRWPR